MHTFVLLRFIRAYLFVLVCIPHTRDGDAVLRSAACLSVLHETITTKRHAVATRHILLAPLHEREAKPIVVIVTARAGGFNLRGLLFDILKLALSPVEQCAADCLQSPDRL